MYASLCIIMNSINVVIVLFQVSDLDVRQGLIVLFIKYFVFSLATQYCVILRPSFTTNELFGIFGRCSSSAFLKIKGTGPFNLLTACYTIYDKYL